ncbi:MAG: PDGLE domain-containing protein [Pseudanabaenaceae cyanobacterium bins.39]|nr:PDGLE domain-containing protein [Pseudanabaenaceae cyanobacterium bins.39]
MKPVNYKVNYKFVLGGLLISLAIAALIAPLASTDPDGLDRVSQDLKFANKANQEPITQKLPPSQIFAEYSVKAVENPKMSTAIAGIAGTLVTFGLAWGLGKLTVRSAPKQESQNAQNEEDRS